MHGDLPFQVYSETGYLTSATLQRHVAPTLQEGPRRIIERSDTSGYPELRAPRGKLETDVFNNKA